MLVNLNEILPQARKGHYAIGAFNTSNLIKKMSNNKGGYGVSHPQ